MTAPASPAEFELHLPDDFEDYAWDVRQKGYFLLATISSNSRVYEISFFTPDRLKSELAHAFESRPYFAEKNIVVIPELDRAHMEEAASALAREAFTELA